MHRSSEAGVRDSLHLPPMDGGRGTFGQAFSSLSFMCIRTLRPFRLQLTLQGLPYFHRRIKRFEWGGIDAKLPQEVGWGLRVHLEPGYVKRF